MLARTHPLLRVARVDSACAKKNNVLQVALERKCIEKASRLRLLLVSVVAEELAIVDARCLLIGS